MRQVIRSALRGIEGQIEYGQCRRGTVVGALVTVGIELLHIHFTHIVVGELVEVALDVTGGERAAAAGEDRIYVIPCQQGTVVATRNVRLVGTL